MTTQKSIKNDVMQLMVDGAVAEGSKPAVVAKSDEVKLDSKQLALIGESVKEYIVADDLLFQGDAKKDEVAKAIAKVLGTTPSYAFWELTRTTWETTYMAKNQLANEKSANNAWLDNTKRIKAKFGLEKPKAPSKDASRMSEKRKAEQAELQAKPDSVLREEYLAYKADDNLTKATAIKKEIDRREKLANGDVIEKRKAKIALLVGAVKKITDDDLLDKLWSQIPQSIKLELAKSAK